MRRSAKQAKPRQPLRVAVIGTINNDLIIGPDSHRIRSLGGMLYNIRALGQLLGERAVIMPVTRVGDDLAETVAASLAASGNVDLSAVRVVAGPHNQCIIRYQSVSERVETLSGWVGAVGWGQIEQALSADMILINFISGRDITWHNLQRLRRAFNGPLYIDLHSRALALARDGRRYLRRPGRWREYVHCADFLQMNEYEYAAIAGEPPGEASCINFARRNLRTRAALLVTLGAQGYLLAERRGKQIRFMRCRATKTLTSCETTGCGDVFAAGMVCKLLVGASISTAAGFANRAAGHAASCASLEQLNLGGLRI